MATTTLWVQNHSRKHSDRKCQSHWLEVHLHTGAEDTAEFAGVE